MRIQVDKLSTVFLSDQIRQQITDRIRSGLLKENDPLPSIRNLGSELCVSPVTVTKAYKKLEADGLIERIHGKGTFVKGGLFNAPYTPDKKERFQWQTEVKDYLGRAQFAKEMHLIDFDHPYNLAEASICPELLPTKQVVKNATNQLSKHIDLLDDYGTGEGDIGFRTKLATILKKDDINTAPEDLIITNGGQQALNLIINTFIGANDVVVIEAPTYPGIIDMLVTRGARIITLPIDSSGLKTDELHLICEKYKPKMVYTIPRYHNPTGVSMSDKRKRDLISIAETYNLLIVEDDPWSELTFTKNKTKPLSSYDTNGHVIYVKGYSKLIGPTYRLGVLSAKGTIIDRLKFAKSNADLGSSILIQKLIEPIFEQKTWEKYTTQLALKMKNRAEIVCKILNEHAPKELKWTYPKGGINLWCTLPNEISAVDLLNSVMYKEGISFLPGVMFYYDQPKHNTFRLTFSYVNEKALEKGIVKMCRLIEEYIT